MRHAFGFLPRFGLTLSLGLLVACGPQSGLPSGPAGPTGTGGPPPAPEVNVIRVSERTVDLTTDLSGRLQAVRTAVVRARVEGVVQHIRYIEGSDVRAGTPLFEIDPRTYRAAAEAARAEAAAAQQNWLRNQALVEAKAVSQLEFDASLARHKQAQATLAKADLDLENALVQAPLSGRIGRSMVTEGALVGRGDSTPMASIDQLDPIWVNFSQTESEWQALRRAMDKGELKANAQWRVQLLQADGRPYPLNGQLKLAERTVDPNTGAVFLRAEFPNPKGELMPGSFVRVRLEQASMPAAITVPQRAVMMNPQGPYVLVVGEGDKVAPVPIQTGAMSGDQWVVKSGLQLGMRVVVDGLQKARPGTVVRVVELNVAK
ncbi:MAG: efflux RND transporter periplasmic adaptor subunit [Alphaproteobacteria bacterium]|nr:efflux RND transporter periplasmic adaptor subunit [Alphaproteobacteria bacterium]